MMMPDLKKLEGKPQVGVAMMPDGTELLAEFCLCGRDTYLNLHGASEELFFSREVEVIQIKMTDWTWLTFLKCVETTATRYSGGPAGSTRVVTFLPSFVLVGRQPVTEKHKLTSLSLSVDDAETIFYDFDAFAVALDADEQVKAMIANQAETLGRPIEVGAHPIGIYFTGKTEILSADTEVGKISVRHQPSHGMGGPEGVSLNNEIHITVDFSQPKDTAEAIDFLMPLLRFLQIIAGRKQKIRSLHVKVEDGKSWLSLVWCLAWTRHHEGSKPHPADLPINGGMHPGEFAQVLTKWVGADSERKDARVRFSGGFAQERSYSIDRLVSAANMFDILPAASFAAPAGLPPEIAKARDESRALFKALPKSDLRDRALGDLGRLDKLNLKTKVLQRAEKLHNAAPGKYPDLDKVLKSAVDARNHYVHGTAATPEKAQFYGKWMSFHVDALEFVFATTDLLDAGWNYQEWASQGTTMSHPFGEFKVNYPARMAQFLPTLQQ